MPDTPLSLSVVIMAFNEERSLPKQVQATLEFLDRHATVGQVVVVDDGSTDGTARVAGEIADRDSRVVVVVHPANLGMGQAIRSGYAAATCEWVTQLPGDGQVLPRTLARFLPHLADHDLVLSTYAHRDDGLLRAVVTVGYRTTARVLLHNPCAFTGTMMFRRDLLDGERLVCDTFMVNVEVPLKLMRKGVAPAWVTIEAVPREHGRSKVLSLERVVRVVREMVVLRRELVLPSG